MADEAEALAAAIAAMPVPPKLPRPDTLDAEGRRRAYSEELLRMYGAAMAWHAAQAVMPNISIGASRFVTIRLAAMITGLTEKAIRRKIERGVWLEGKHFRRADGGIYIDIQGVEKWVAKA